jgi:hypothetical protein
MPEPKTVGERDEHGPHEYEPPRIEEVLCAEDLEREVHYAGVPSRIFG